MERKDFTTIADVLRECLESSAMQERLEEVRACDAFAAVVGRGISSLCSKPTMKRGVMSVGVNNASLRSELHMRRSSIAAAINEISGKETVKDIIFKS
ncbi:MAG: DUF721 domain-containing protein [Muribaculaceae bacterium]|nr:DUF721 domain-containing protein [Muribaculaceae bacterium]